MADNTDNDNCYEDAEQQIQECDENQERQLTVYTGVPYDCPNQDQTIPDQGLDYEHHTNQGLITSQQTTFYGIQPPFPLYGNGFMGMPFQGHSQNGPIIFPVQIPGNMFYPTQIFNQYSNGIFQNLTDVQTFQPYMSPNQDVQQTIPPDQDVQETTICIPPHQDVQQTTSSDTSDNDTDHQTWQHDYKPWYCSEFIDKKKNDEEDTDDHKPVETESQDPAPEVVQEVLEETEEKAVSTPDEATTSDYAENLWELICKFCPAESSVDSLLDSHLCDRSLAEPQHGGLICNTCFTRVPTSMTLETHKNTRRHLLLLLNYKGDAKIDELHFFYCSSCRVQCYSNTDFINHMLSQKHIEFEECLPFYLYYCSQCKLTMDATAYEVHVSSKTHLINCMISNIKFFCLITKLDVSNLYCKICNEKCLNGKLYKAHQYSAEHCSNLLELKLKDDFSHSDQYVFFNNNKYLCVLCKISITDKTSLIYHFLTDEHMIHEERFEKMQHSKFVSGEFYMTTHIKGKYLQCSECKTLQRDCEHMFKNENEYKTWKKKMGKGKHCMYCNCFSDWSHESSKFHIKMKSAINYCKVCDKVLTIDIVKHEQGRRHKLRIKMFGTEGVDHKRGPSKMYCGICNLNSENEKAHIQHFAGVKHRKNYNTKFIENKYHCKLCNFTVTELYQYEEHEKSIDHVSKLNNIDKEFDHFKFCFICRQPLTNITISEHIETAQHFDAIKMM